MTLIEQGSLRWLISRSPQGDVAWVLYTSRGSAQEELCAQGTADTVKKAKIAIAAEVMYFIVPNKRGPA